jgi:hypothetical protein
MVLIMGHLAQTPKGNGHHERSPPAYAGGYGWPGGDKAEGQWRRREEPAGLRRRLRGQVATKPRGNGDGERSPPAYAGGYGARWRQSRGAMETTRGVRRLTPVGRRFVPPPYGGSCGMRWAARRVFLRGFALVRLIAWAAA